MTGVQTCALPICLIELQRVETPEMSLARQATLMLRVLAMALGLLKMLRSKEHALRPDNATAITHQLFPDLAKTT